jgi:peptidoglycan/LPS O-acetylase OafA/YrhL
LFCGVLAVVVLAGEGKLLEAAVGLITAALIWVGRGFRFRKNAVGQSVLWLATISYSLYLVHVPIDGRVVNLGSRFVETPLQELGLSVLALAVSLFAAWLFHIAIERPSLKWARSIGRHWRAKERTLSPTAPGVSERLP